MKKQIENQSSPTNERQGDKLISDFLIRVFGGPLSPEEEAKKSVTRILKEIDKEETKDADQKCA